nr:MAG TPA: hypothetical protein [Caudoviricetes sp.]
MSSTAIIYSVLSVLSTPSGLFCYFRYFTQSAGRCFCVL